MNVNEILHVTQAPQVVLLLGVLTVWYLRGWTLLRRKGSRMAGGWKLTSYLAGIVVLGIAILSPIEGLADELFSAHMVQHIVIAIIGPALLLLGQPFPLYVWGLPARWRRRLRRPTGASQRIFRFLFNPWWVWGIYTAVTWLWHMSGLYNAALESEVVHIIEHTFFFLTGVFYWWHQVGAYPHAYGQPRFGVGIVYSLASFFQCGILGAGLALIQTPLYPHYAALTERAFGLSVMDDQMLGGAIMWVVGGVLFALPAVFLTYQLMARSERQNALEPA